MTHRQLLRFFVGTRLTNITDTILMIPIMSFPCSTLIGRKFAQNFPPFDK